MAVYFIDYDLGNDTTGDGSVATPLKTVEKAIGASPYVTLSGSGDVIVMVPGIHRGTLAVGVTPTGSSTVTIVGDSDGAYQVAAGSSTPKLGLVDWRAWTDSVTPINTLLIDSNGKSYVTVSNIKMTGGKSASPSTVSITSASTNWTFTNCNIIQCAFAAYTSVWIATGAAAATIAFNRCHFSGANVSSGAYAIQVRTPLNSTEYSIGLSFTDCAFFGGGIQIVTVGGSGSAWSSGITIQSCSFFYCYATLTVTTTVNLTTPISVKDCVVGNTFTNPMSASNTTLVAEDGNQFTNATVYSNVTAGTHSRVGVCPAFDVGDDRISGRKRRPFGEPKLVSPFTGLAANYGTISSVDINNRKRPAGSGVATAAAGAYERHDTARLETTTTDSGNGWAIDGPGEQIIEMAVAAASTTRNFKFRYDSSYGAGTKPQLVLLSRPAIGVTTATATMTAAADTWETLTVGPFTPTAKGSVKLKLVSHSAAAGKVFIDRVS